MNVRLEITIGSTQPIEIEILNAADSVEDLSNVDEATFTVQNITDSPPTVLELSIAAGDLAVQGGSLIGTIDQSTSDALIPGIFAGQAFVRFGADTDWRPTGIFSVEFITPVANKVTS